MIIIQDKEQHVLIRVTHNDDPSFFISMVYAICSEELNKDLWDDMRTIANNIEEPWGDIGDFNVINSSQEKKG